MKNRKIKPGILVIFIFLGIAVAEAQVEKQVHHYKAYQLEPGILVEITNKYGTVDLETWDKDSVTFDIDLKASAKNKEKIKKLFDDIEFRFIKTDKRVSAKTLIGESRNQFIQDITNLASAITSLGVDAEINYKVRIPKNNPVKIVNSFGDIYTDNLLRNTQIYISHGDLRAGNFAQNLELDIRFGKAYLRNLGDARIVSRYSDLISIREAGKIKLVSKSSYIDAQKIYSLEIDSRSDRIDVDELSKISGMASFSKLNIRKFKLEANLNYKFGNINFDHILTGFNSITLKTSLTDVSLRFETGASYTFEMTAKDTDFRYPDKLKLDKSHIGTSKDEFRYSGSVGSGTSRSKVRIDAEKGEILIIQK